MFTVTQDVAMNMVETISRFHISTSRACAPFRFRSSKIQGLSSFRRCRRGRLDLFQSAHELTKTYFLSVADDVYRRRNYRAHDQILITVPPLDAVQCEP